MIGFQGRMASSLGSHPESAFSCPSLRGQRQSGEVGSEEAVPSTRSNEEFDRVGHQEPIKPYQGDTVFTAQYCLLMLMIDTFAPSFFTLIRRIDFLRFLQKRQKVYPNVLGQFFLTMNFRYGSC